MNGAKVNDEENSLSSNDHGRVEHQDENRKQAGMVPHAINLSTREVRQVMSGSLRLVWSTQRPKHQNKRNQKTKGNILFPIA